MIPALIGAGATLLGGLLGKSSAEKQNAANIAAQNAINDKNIALQKEFAQTGIQWKVEDAKKAGIHPLYAMGAPTTSFSNVVGGPYPSADMSMPNAIAAAGQDIGRAVNSTRTAADRDDAFTTSVKALELQNFSLKNELLAAQISKLRAGINPPFPDPQVADPYFPQDTPAKRPPLAIGGVPFHSAADTANADQFEERYGELSDWSFGPAVLWRDLTHNFAVRVPPAYRRGVRRKFGNAFDRFLPK